MPVGIKLSGGFVIGINVDDCTVVDEDDELEEGSVLQVFLGFWVFYVVVRG